MTYGTIPNDAISNLSLLLSIPLITIGTMSVKVRLCDRRMRLPAQYSVDQYLMVTSNMLSYACMIIWASVLPGDALSRLEDMVVLDISLGLILERYLMRTVHRLDTEPYHAPGPLSKSRRLRRTAVAYTVAILLRTMWVAVTDVTGTMTVTRGADKYEYYCTILAIPSVYTMVRTLLLDTIYPDVLHGTVDEIEQVTNSFTIDGDGEDGEDDMEIDLDTGALDVIDRDSV